MKRLLAECLGTFFIVFAGTGAIIVEQQTGALGHCGVALVWGLVVMAMIYTFGDASGAHFNPAVTLGFTAAKRFPKGEVLGYLVGQMTGALSASASLAILFPNSGSLGMTSPSGSIVQTFLLEMVLTAALMLTILNVSSGAKEKGITAGLAIGAMVGLEAMFAGPICGASMNPARSLAPALISGHFQHLWLYPAATISGALFAIPLAKLTQPTPP